MNHFIFLLPLFLLAQSCSSQPLNMKEITQNGMTVAWKLEDDRLHINLFAPTDGWVAIGLNTTAELTGTNLIMGCIVAGQVTLSDRYIVAPGNHRSITDLGGTSVARVLSGTETKAGTRLEFTLPLKAADQWHHDLPAGKKIHLLMAFSREDDFAHHSMMRTSVEISL